MEYYKMCQRTALKGQKNTLKNLFFDYFEKKSKSKESTIFQ